MAKSTPWDEEAERSRVRWSLWSPLWEDLPWIGVPVHQLTEREQHLADPPIEELEDWDTAPLRFPARPHPAEFEDLTLLVGTTRRARRLVREAAADDRLI